MHLDLGGVQIDRRARLQIATDRAVQPACGDRERSLDLVQMPDAEAPRVLPRRRRCRDPGNGPQPCAGAVVAERLEVVEAFAADQLRFRQSDHEFPGRVAAPADLHRPGTLLAAHAPVDLPDQVQSSGDLAGDRQPRVWRQRRVIGAELDPSERDVTVVVVHPQGAPPNRSYSGFGTLHDPGPAGQKAPQKRGFLHQTTNATATTETPTPNTQTTDLGQRPDSPARRGGQTRWASWPT